MRVNPKYIEVLGDTIIPLLGFFLWEWDLYFIVLYFILELIFSEVFLHLKISKIHTFQKENKSWMLYGIIGGIALIIVILLIHFGFLLLNPTIDFPQQIFLFISYEDMGIAQGYILFPLLLISGYQKYKLEFIRMKKHETSSIQSLWKSQLAKYLFVTLLVGFCAILSLMGINSSLIYLAIILLASAGYKIFIHQF
jgi:hypothetical protein